MSGVLPKRKNLHVLLRSLNFVVFCCFSFLIVIPEFISQVNIALESLSKNTVHLFDDNQFVEISKKVYDTIHTIRCSVMMIRVSLGLFFPTAGWGGAACQGIAGSTQSSVCDKCPKLTSRLNWPGKLGLQWNVWLWLPRARTPLNATSECCTKMALLL